MPFPAVQTWIHEYNTKQKLEGAYWKGVINYKLLIMLIWHVFNDMCEHSDNEPKTAIHLWLSAWQQLVLPKTRSSLMGARGRGCHQRVEGRRSRWCQSLSWTSSLRRPQDSVLTQSQYLVFSRRHIAPREIVCCFPTCANWRAPVLSNNRITQIFGRGYLPLPPLLNRKSTRTAILWCVIF